MGWALPHQLLIKKLSHRLAAVPLPTDDSSLCSVYANYKLTSTCLSFPRVHKVGDQVWEPQSPDAHWALTSTLCKFNSFSCSSSTKHSAAGQARSQPTGAHFLRSSFPIPSRLSSFFFILDLIFLDSPCWHSTQPSLCLGTFHAPPRQAFRTICLCAARPLSAHSPAKEKIKYFLFFFFP